MPRLFVNFIEDSNAELGNRTFHFFRRSAVYTAEWSNFIKITFSDINDNANANSNAIGGRRQDVFF